MSEQARYAIYLAPEQDGVLARFIAEIIGYDVFSGKDVAHPDHPFPATDWHAMTSEPRRYGAHATLKAPFRLALGTARSELETAIASFARTRKAFDIGPLAVTCVSRTDSGGFVALTNPYDSPDLKQLEAGTVRAFKPFQAALSSADLARRNPDRLTQRQQHYLAEFGYPFVLDEFAFHITLTNRLSAPELLADHLAERMAQNVGTSRFRVDALYLFEQSDPDARFRIAGRFPLAA